MDENAKKYNEYAKEFKEILDEFENDFTICKQENSKATPLLTAEDLALLREFGEDGIEKAMKSIESLKYFENLIVEDEEEEASWYDQRTSIGVINVITGLLVIGGAVGIQTEPQLDLDVDLKKELTRWKKNHKNFSFAEFGDYLKTKDVGLHMKFREQFNIENYKSAKRKRKLFKYSSLLAGGVLTGIGALMTSSGQGMFLTQEKKIPCFANQNLKSNLEDLFFAVKSTNLEDRIMYMMAANSSN